ncbi:tRNA (adenine(22)-N(1))-methyltransferase [Oceanobacillus sp. CAU 1775]
MNADGLKISERLIHVASQLSPGAKFIDIGSDHAYLPCYVCLRDQAAYGIAGEVNVGPYESAKKTVKKHGLEKRIDVRLANGLEAIRENNEVEELVIAGMGGALISTILETGKEKLTNINKIIAQPNIDARRVRKWFDSNGFQLTDEFILEEKGHIYEILVANRNDESPYDKDYKEKQLFLGPYLLKNKSKVFKEKWSQERVKLLEIIEQMKQADEPNLEKISQFNRELKWIEEELSNE